MHNEYSNRKFQFHQYITKTQFEQQYTSYKANLANKATALTPYKADSAQSNLKFISGDNSFECMM